MELGLFLLFLLNVLRVPQEHQSMFLPGVPFGGGEEAGGGGFQFQILPYMHICIYTYGYIYIWLIRIYRVSKVGGFRVSGLRFRVLESWV